MTTDHHETDFDVVVRRRRAVADGVVELWLSRDGDSDLPAWSPGAHVDLILDDGLTRQYSLCSEPGELGAYRVAVLAEPSGRGGSRRIHEHVHRGARVRLRGPRNQFPLESSPRYVFIAGGIGITPILVMIAEAEQAGAEWTLLYGGRQRQSMAYAQELSNRYGDKVSVQPQDEVGLIDLTAAIGTPLKDTLVYCCGPEPLLKAVEGLCRPWPEGSLRVERFAPKEIHPASPDGEFEVELARSQKVFTIPADRTILSVLDEADVYVDASCMDGVCGTCETTVLDGKVDHRDSILTDAEQAANNAMMICVSRAACPRLLLDL
jgi:ferredoxin-NADP reductase